ncbi:hypothetical protein BDZ89DRAFT_1066812 [Hymenopellis radicata]|nr:hypothetical protein BDZ89DRAFT_1066812 [Hymenopellis radicata]
MPSPPYHPFKPYVHHAFYHAGTTQSLLLQLKQASILAMAQYYRWNAAATITPPPDGYVIVNGDWVYHSTRLRQYFPDTEEATQMYNLITQAIRGLYPDDVLAMNGNFYLRPEHASHIWAAVKLIFFIILGACNNSRIPLDEADASPRRIPTIIPADSLSELGYTPHVITQDITIAEGIERRREVPVDLPVPFFSTNQTYIGACQFHHLRDLLLHYDNFMHLLVKNVEMLMDFMDRSIALGTEARVNWGAPFGMTAIDWLLHVDAPRVRREAASRHLSIGDFVREYIPADNSNDVPTVTFPMANPTADPSHFEFPYDPHFPFFNFQLYCSHCHRLGCNIDICPFLDGEDALSPGTLALLAAEDEVTDDLPVYSEA